MRYTQSKEVNLTTAWTTINPNFIINYWSVYVISGTVEVQTYSAGSWSSSETIGAANISNSYLDCKKIRIKASTGVAQVNYYVEGNVLLISDYTEKVAPANDDTFLIEDSADSGNIKKVKYSNIGGGVSVHNDLTGLNVEPYNHITDAQVAALHTQDTDTILQTTSAEVQDQFNTGAHTDDAWVIPNAEDMAAQTFTAGRTGDLSKVKLYIKKHASNTKDLIVEIRTTSGGEPTAVVLATETITKESISTDWSWVTVTFSSPTAVVTSTLYAIVLRTDGGSTEYYICYDYGNVYTDGHRWAYYSEAWEQDGENKDLPFYTYVTLSTGDLFNNGALKADLGVDVGILIDGRDISVDGTKLDGIEALADVTDVANVTAALASINVNALSDITSAGADIEDAVTKRHTQGTDTTLGSMTADIDMNSFELDSVAGIGIGAVAEANAYLNITDKYIICKVFTSTGINACIDALGTEGGEVYLPEGTYVIDSTITIDYNNTMLRGAGRGTILDSSGWSVGHSIDINGCDYCTFKDFAMKGAAGTGNTTSLIYSSGSGSIWCENLYLYDADFHGIYFDASGHKNTITNCEFYNFDTHTGARAVSFETGDYHIVNNNHFEIGREACTFGNNSHYEIFDGNTVENFIVGFYGGDSDYYTCSNNYFGNCYYGVLHNAGYGVIIGNNFNRGTHGIYAFQGKLIIDGNKFETQSNSQILFGTSDDYNIISNNWFYSILGNTYFSINLSSSDGNIIEGNHFKGRVGGHEKAINLINSSNNIIQGNWSDTHDTCGIELDATSDNNHVVNNHLEGEAVAKIIDGGSNNTIINSVAGEVFFGDGGITNYSKFEADGTLEFNGAATVWNDLVLPLDSAKVPAANAPNWESFVGNLNAFAYQVNDFQEFTAELLHGYKTGSTIEFHIHGVLNALTAQEETVKFEIEYSIADMNPITGFGDVFPATTTINAELTVPNATADLTSIFITIGTNSSGSFAMGATIKGRVRRIASSGTELTGNIFLTQVGIHYEIDTVGSRQLTTK